MKETEQLKQIIKEELSVNNEVIMVVQKICNKIIKIVPTVEGEILKNRVVKRKFHFSETILNNKISIQVINYNFVTPDEISRNPKLDYETSTSSSDGGKYNFLFINCYSVNGEINRKSLFDTVYHEIEHIFQAQKGNKQIKTFDALYHMLPQYLNCKNYPLKYASRILYCSYAYEQDAFVNGLYGFISQLGIIPQWKDIKTSQAYKSLENLRNALSFLQKNINNEKYNDEIKKVFGYTISQILKIGKQTEKRFLEKVGKVLIKHRNEILFENIIIRTNNGITKYFEEE